MVVWTCVDLCGRVPGCVSLEPIRPSLCVCRNGLKKFAAEHVFLSRPVIAYIKDFVSVSEFRNILKVNALHQFFKQAGSDVVSDFLLIEQNVSRFITDERYKMWSIDKIKTSESTFFSQVSCLQASRDYTDMSMCTGTDVWHGHVSDHDVCPVVVDVSVHI